MIRALLPISLLALSFPACGPSGMSVPSIFNRLGPQEYTWHPQRSTSGPVLIFVSLPLQEAMVYRNGVRIGRASVSTGKPGHETPTGVFQILQKDIDHHSKTYGNAPMPYMERLTWDGVALHTGFNPGHPASHGCIRMPDGFAKELFKITHVGGTVVVSNSKKPPVMGLVNGPGGGGSGSGNWSGLSKTAPTSVVVSTHDRKAVVYQNGKKAASATVEVKGGLASLEGEEAFLYAGDHQWHTVEGNDDVSDMSRDLIFPDGLRNELRRITHPGTTMVVTSEPLSTRGGTSRNLLSVGSE